MKNKLAIIKTPSSPDKEDMNYVSKLFKSTEYKPIFITSNFAFKNKHLIIGA